MPTDELADILTKFQAPAPPKINSAVADRANEALTAFSSKDDAARDTIKSNRQALAGDASETLRSAGLPQPPQGFFFPPSGGKPRDYLYSYSGGRLDLPDNAIPAHQLELHRSTALADLLTKNPLVRDYICNTPGGLQALNDNLDQIAAINLTPPSGKETLAAADSAIRDWTATKKLDAPKDPTTLRTALLKAGATLRGAEGFGDLTSDEARTLNDAGGPDLADFWNKRRKALVSRNRLNTLFGTPDQADANAPLPEKTSAFERFGGAPQPSSADPPEARLDHLAAHSPFLANLFQLKQDPSVAAAQQAVDRRNTEDNHFGAYTAGLYGDLLNQYGTRAGLVSSGLKALGGGMGLIDSALGGIPSHAIGVGDTIAQSVGSITGDILRSYNLPVAATPGRELDTAHHGMVAAWGKIMAASSDKPDLASNAAVLDNILASNPHLNETERTDLLYRTFNGVTATTELVRRTGRAMTNLGLTTAGVGPVLNYALALDSPEVSSAAGELLGPMVDSPTMLATAALGLAKFGGRPVLGEIKPIDTTRTGIGLNPLKAAARFTARATLEGEVRAEATAPPTYADIAAHARLLDTYMQDLYNTTDANAARQITQRLSRSLDSTTGLDPESYAGAKQALSEASARFNALAGTKLDPSARTALGNLAPYVAHLDPYEAAFTITGDINRAASAAIVNKAEAWLNAQKSTKEQLPVPLAVPQARAMQADLVSAATKSGEFQARRARVRDILGSFESQSTIELLAHEQKLETLEGLNRSHADAFNGTITSTLAKFKERELVGTSTFSANPEVNSYAFETANRALRSGQLDDLTVASRIRDVRRRMDRFGVPQFATGEDLLRVGAEESEVVYRPALRAAIQGYIEDALKPIETKIPAAETPRLSLIKSIEDKLGALQPGEVVKLSDAERKALNEVRGKATLKANTYTPHEDRLAAIDATKTARERTRGLRDEARQILDRAEQATPEDPTLKISGRLANAIKDKISAFEGAEDMRARSRLSGDNRFISLAESLTDRELSTRAAVDELTRELPQEHRDIVRGLNKLSSFEMGHIAADPTTRPLLGPILKSVFRAAEGYINHIRFQSKRINELLDRDVPRSERLQLLRDLADGTPRSEAGAILIRHQRLDQLASLLKEGIISADHYHALIRDDYYHGHFDPALAQRLKDATQRTGPIGNLSGRFRPLRIDPGEFKGKIPEEPGEYHLAYRDGPAISYRGGFKTPEEAAAFADSLPASIKDATIRKNLTLTDKTMRGLIGLPEVSSMTLNEQIAQHIAAHRLGKIGERTGLMKTASDLETEGATIAADGTATIDGARWTKLPSTQTFGPFAGRYVHQDFLGWLNEYTSSSKYLSAITKAIGEAATPTKDNPLVDPLSSTFGKVKAGALATVRGAGSLLAYSKVAFSPHAWAQARVGNIFYSWLAGIPLNAEGIRARMVYEAEHWKRVRSSQYDELQHGLVKRGSLSADDLNIPTPMREVTEAATRHWTSSEGLANRISDLERQMLEPKRTVEDLAQLTAYRDELKTQYSESIHEDARKAHATLFQKGSEVFAQEAKSVLTGSHQGRVSQFAWGKVYSLLGGDAGTKYAIGRWLMDKEGFTLDQALDSVEAFTQHLNRTPKAAKEIAGKFGGANFVSWPAEQLRIVGNAARNYPARMAKAMLFLNLFNTAALSSQGIDPDRYLEWNAASNGVSRSPVTDAMYLFNHIVVPFVGNEGHSPWSISTGQIGGDLFTPRSPWAKALSKTVGSTNGYLRLATDAGIGLASNFFFSDQAFQNLDYLKTGRDEKGDPVTTGTDLIKMIYRQATPDWVPGNKMYEQIALSLAGNNRNPSDYHNTGVFEYMFKTLFNASRSFTSSQRLYAAVAQIRAQSPSAQQYQAALAFDEQLHTILARMPNATQAERAQAVKDWYADNPHLVPSASRNIVFPSSADQGRNLYAKVREVDRAGALVSFHGLRELPDKIAAYTLYQRLGTPDTADSSVMTSEIMKSLNHISGQDATRILPSLKAFVDDQIKSGGLPPQLQSRLRSWVGMVAGVPLKKYMK